MALVSIKDMLNKARKEKYCVGAFDASTLEMAQKIIEAAEEKVSCDYYGINTRSAGRYA